MNCTFSIENGCLVRNIAVNGGGNAKSFIRPEDIGLEKPFEKLIDYDKAWLQCKQKPLSSGKNGDIRVVDLFSGCGGLTLGIAEACRALEYNFVPVLAADLAPSALDLYKRNFNPIHTIAEPIEQWINSELGEELSEEEKKFTLMVGQVDILIGGPPCQGNSDLNNHTRRADPRNLLYLRMIRCVEILRPRYVLIENVPGVKHDTHNVVETAKEQLMSFGYSIDFGTIDMSTIGVAQKRKRFFLIASRCKQLFFNKCLAEACTESRPLSWAIDDLLECEDDTVFNSPAKSSATNSKRIDYQREFLSFPALDEFITYSAIDQ